MPGILPNSVSYFQDHFALITYMFTIETSGSCFNVSCSNSLSILFVSVSRTASSPLPILIGFLLWHSNLGYALTCGDHQ